MGGRPLVLGELEAAVLGHLWDRGPADAKAVHRALGRKRRITLNTVQSAMERLFRKELLSREKVSHAYVYSPRATRMEVGRRLLRQLTKQLRGDRRDALLFAFSELTDAADEETLIELERLVALRRREVAARR